MDKIDNNSLCNSIYGLAHTITIHNRSLSDAHRNKNRRKTRRQTVEEWESGANDTVSKCTRRRTDEAWNDGMNGRHKLQLFHVYLFILINNVSYKMMTRLSPLAIRCNGVSERQKFQWQAFTNQVRSEKMRGQAENEEWGGLKRPKSHTKSCRK